MQAIFVSTMQQGQRRHLSLVFWNGAGYALQDLTVLVGQHMKENALKEHTGEFRWFLYCASSLVFFTLSLVLPAVMSDLLSKVAGFEGNIIIASCVCHMKRSCVAFICV